MRPGSLSMRLYPHLELGASEIVAELLGQARLAEDAGFDGLMVSEHHNGFAGYLPNPIQTAGWILDTTRTAWAAPCPLLLPLRSAALVAEELAWLAARFPGRVGVGLAAGSLEADFAVAGTTKADLTRRFAEGMAAVVGMLSGRDPAPLPDDPAIRRCAAEPVPIVSAAMSPAACRRAAAVGVGLLIDSLSTVSRCRELADVYRQAGGPGPVVLIRRAMPATPDTGRHEQQLRTYRSYAEPAASRHWSDDPPVTGDATAIAASLMAQAAEVGVDSLNIRVHAPGMSPTEIRTNIAALADVVAALRRDWRPSA
jgi:alkanesulfonate monooxygenase SsuD/methylene tetrahydromethanopterin reductase-like flavin-dependent oxidoreductase (luciferase family)